MPKKVSKMLTYEVMMYRYMLLLRIDISKGQWDMNANIHDTWCMRLKKDSNWLATRVLTINARDKERTVDHVVVDHLWDSRYPLHKWERWDSGPCGYGPPLGFPQPGRTVDHVVMDSGPCGYGPPLGFPLPLLASVVRTVDHVVMDHLWNSRYHCWSVVSRPMSSVGTSVLRQYRVVHRPLPNEENERMHISCDTW